MILTKRFNVALATSLVAALFTGASAAAQEEARAEEAPAKTAGERVDEATRSVEEEVQGTAEDKASKRRRELVQDAVGALDETRKALKALEGEETEAALESLAVAIGKLELVVARNPELALAPVDVQLVTHDVFVTMEGIEEAKEEALELMEEGRLQDARALIEHLRSDVVVEVLNMPLATYPDAIRAITPLIDEGEIEKAKTVLQQALNTLVVTEYTHVLPVIRAEHMLTRAEELAETEDRSGKEGEELGTLLDGARRQLEMAQALGYGEKSDFEDFYEQLEEIARKTRGGKSGSGFFDEIRAALRSAFGGSETVSRGVRRQTLSSGVGVRRQTLSSHFHPECSARSMSRAEEWEEGV